MPHGKSRQTWRNTATDELVDIVEIDYSPGFAVVVARKHDGCNQDDTFRWALNGTDSCTALMHRSDGSTYSHEGRTLPWMRCWVRVFDSSDQE